MKEDAQSSYHSSRQVLIKVLAVFFFFDVFFFMTVFFYLLLVQKRVLAPPTFGSSPNFEALTQAYKHHAEDDDSAVNAQLPNSR